MLMVTSPWDLCLPQRPRGLVPKFLGPGRQFRGGWFQRRKISISEFEFQQIFQGCGCNNICHTILFFSSLTTDMNPATKRPRVPAGQPGKVYNAPGVSVYYFFLAFRWLLIPFRSPSLWLPWGKVTNGKCGSSFGYRYCYQRTVHLETKILY